MKKYIIVTAGFTTEDLLEIWQETRFENKQAELLKLMKEYGLCFELKGSSGFIAPDLLPIDKLNNIEWDYSSNLHFEIRYDFMPAGMLSRFIVKSHSFIFENKYWKNGVILQYDNTFGMVEEDYIHTRIKISLRGDNKKGLLSAIRMYIEEVHMDFDKANKLSFQEMVPCNCSECIQSATPHFYKFSVLKKFEQKAKTTVPCEITGEDVKIRGLINDVEVPNQLNQILSNEDLQKFVLEILTEALEKEIMYKEGYINFWRNQECTVPKNEIEIQPYVTNVIDNYCKVRGISLGREIREANGCVDVVLTYTTLDQQILKVCIEIKKAHHQDVVSAINTQLPVYMSSAGTDTGIYLIIWLKNDQFKEPANYENEKNLLTAIEDTKAKRNNIAIKIINCTKKISPSKIKS